MKADDGDVLSQLADRFPALLALGRTAHRPPGEHITVVHQAGATDCGAACLAMVLAHHGHHVALDQVANAMRVGRDGATAREIVETARVFGLVARGVRLELDELPNIARGSILYLDFSHFVVFDRIEKKNGRIHVLDPSAGRRVLTWKEAETSFTGVALLFEKAATFVRKERAESPLIRHLKLILADRRVIRRIVVVSLLLQVMSLLFPFVEGRIADRVLPHNDTHLLWVLLLAMGVTIGFYFVSSLTRAKLLVFLRTRFDAKLTLGFVDHMLKLPFDFFERRQVGDLQMRVGGVAAVRDSLTGALLAALIDGILVVLHLLFLVIMSWKMTAVAAAVVIAQGTVQYATRRRMLELAGGMITRQAEAANALNEVLAGMESLKSSGHEHGASQAWAAKYVEILNINLRKGHLSSISDSVLGAIGMLGPMALLVAGTLEVMTGKMSLGTMLAANAMAVGFIHPAMTLIATYVQLLYIRVHLARIDDVLSTPPEQVGVTRAAHTLGGEIVLDRVSFRYGPKLPIVLDDVSLRVRPGQMVALVGASGSGKTTLGRLMLGLYSPSVGSVCFDGVLASELELRSLRRQLGVVVQRPQIFGSSIRGNIALSDPSASLGQVEAAARRACLHDDVTAMPMKYETPVVAGGASLSGGQRQRLALARALLHDPAILLLDEATSALDSITEKAVEENLAAMGCTKIVIAHRLSTIRRADLIVVLDKGRIVEQGTHETLLSNPTGAYAKLVEAQELMIGANHGGRPQTREDPPSSARPRRPRPTRSLLAQAAAIANDPSPRLTNPAGKKVGVKGSEWPRVAFLGTAWEAPPPDSVAPVPFFDRESAPARFPQPARHDWADGDAGMNSAPTRVRQG